MLRNWELEFKNRVRWVQGILVNSGAKGIIYGNSGGKDCTLVSIICKAATENVMGVIMPCESSRNFGIDKEHALRVSSQYNIRTFEYDLTMVKNKFSGNLESELENQMGHNFELSDLATANMNPRLRMITLYTIGQTFGYLVAGTGNRSEATMGYFTKWGDGANDFNPIADLTVTEIFDFLKYIQAKDNTDLSFIINKAPSAGLWEGQTDETEMGISYKAIDEFLLNGTGTKENIEKIESTFEKTDHKRTTPLSYSSKEAVNMEEFNFQ